MGAVVADRETRGRDLRSRTAGPPERQHAGSEGTRGRGDRAPEAPAQRVALEIRIEPQDRALIFGATESGKSYLASSIANRWDRVLVFDPKHQDDLPNAAICYGIEATLKALPGRVVYRPTVAEVADVAKHFDRAVEKIWLRGGRHGILSHETYMLGNANGGFAPYYAAAHTQGRAIFIPIIDCTQRPLAMPRVCISEATHYFSFFLSDGEDRSTAARYMGQAVREELPFSHDFWYCGRDKITVRVPAIA